MTKSKKSELIKFTMRLLKILSHKKRFEIKRNKAVHKFREDYIADISVHNIESVVNFYRQEYYFVICDKKEDTLIFNGFDTYYISELDDALSVVEMFNKEIYKIQSFEQNYYKFELQIIEYAENFLDELASINNSFYSGISGYTTPIKVYYYYSDCNNLERKGRIVYSKKQSAVYIAIKNTNRFSGTLKRTIRHEVIHYYLNLCDLPCEDESLLFWCFCYIFDAGAYKQMPNERELKIYKAFISCFKQINNLPQYAKSLYSQIIINYIIELKKPYKNINKIISNMEVLSSDVYIKVEEMTKHLIESKQEIETNGEKNPNL